jgi:phosphopantothenoylcysteine decarboxylase/phosphopantothenate--cysteine ligase
MATGVADNMLVTTYLSAKAPVFVAPAMDLDMFKHPTTTRNLELLRSYGNHIIEPAEGELASHLIGKGRMEEPENIVQLLSDYFARKEGDLSGKKILITAGPTYEKLDPVRFIGNYSSGKMGFALANECARRGAQVELVCGPVSALMQTKFPNIHRIDVESAQEMFVACKELYPSMDSAILCAAVADFAPETTAEQKIKRTGDDMIIRLKPNPDIAASLGQMKKQGQTLVGFALETNDEESNAQAKLKKKNFDFIVLNSLKDEGAGFRTDTNEITLITADNRKDYPLKTKEEAAKDIMDELERL